MANLPLAFEPNEGQSRADTLFLARSPSFQLRLNSSEAILALPSPKNPARRALSPSLLHLRLQNSLPHPQLHALDPLPTKINYFKPSGSIPNVPTFAKVEYENVYPGIDLAFHGTEGHLEYDFIIAPGADPKSIRLNFAGAKNIHLASNGDLILETPAGPLVQHKPVLYQGSGSSRHEIAGFYRQISSNLVAFHIGPYDKTQPLVIDPVLDYLAAFSPGTFASMAFSNAIAVDATGSAYIAGYATDNGTAGGDCYNINTQSACGDASIDKLSPDGTTLVYQTVLANSAANAIAVDSSGNAYVAGAAQSPGFGAATNGFQQNPHTGNCPDEFDPSNKLGCTDAFVAVFNASGSALLYSTYLGGQSNDSANGLALDSNNLIYITGMAGSSDFPATPGAFQTTFKAAGLSAIFSAKIDPTKTGPPSLIYSTFLGGDADETVTDTPVGDEGNAIAVDPQGEAYVVGSIHSPNVATAGAFQTQLPSQNTGFVAKFNSLGSQLIWATYLGGNHFIGCGTENVSAIAIDSAGNSYVTGVASSTDFPVTTGAFQTNFLSDSAAFVTKIDPNGAHLIFSTLVGHAVSQNCIGGTSIAIDPSGDIFVAGATALTDFPIGHLTLSPGCYEKNPNEIPNCDAFLAEVDPTGSSLLFSSYLFGRGPTGLALDSAGAAYVAGIATSLPIAQPPPGFETGDAGVFIYKIDLLATGPAVLLSPSALAFNPLAIGQTRSTARATLLENLGNGTLNISSIGASSGFFVSSNHCGSQLPPGQNCAIGVTFNGDGPTDGILTVTDDSFDSPHVVVLHGGENGFEGDFSPGSFDFSDQLVGTSSAPIPVTFKAAGNTNLTIFTVTASGDFSETNTCGKDAALLPIQTSCKLAITFTPTATGTRRGGVTIAYGGSFSNTMSTSGTINFTGNGVAIPLSVAASSSSATVTAGQTARYTLNLSSSPGINDKITVACFDIPNASTCSAPSIALHGATPVSEKISLSTTGHSLAPPDAPTNKIVPQRLLWLALSILLAIATVALFFLTRAHRSWRAIVLCAGSVILCAMLSNCGGSGGRGGGGSGGGSTSTPSGTYNLTVNVSAGGTTKSVHLTLIVQ